MYVQPAVYEESQGLGVGRKWRCRSREAGNRSGGQTGEKSSSDPQPVRLHPQALWGMLVFLLYCSRRVDCQSRGVVVEKLPWSEGKHHSTIAHKLFLAHWARKLSWKEAADSFHTS